jgi:DNA-directed RNA polymerase subunit RPC12/RpoP
MAARTKKRQYKCGYCKELGHNARKCPTKIAEAATPVVDTPAEPEPAPEPVAQVVLSHTTDLTATKQPSPPAVRPAPYECDACGRVGILALLELQDGNKALRCEHCMNKASPKMILKWGASPGDAPK